MDLPAFDTRPSNPLYGPLSVWLMGDNPFDPEDRPETMVALAEQLGVDDKRLHQIRRSKGFRKFHAEHTTNLDEIVTRRQEALNRLYELGMSGNVQALNAYLQQTKLASSLATAGKQEITELDVKDAANLSDEDLQKFLDNQK